MPANCPACKKPTSLDLNFIIQHPTIQCPYCKTVMTFKVSEEMKKELKEVLASMENLKRKYKGIATFGQL